MKKILLLILVTTLIPAHIFAELVRTNQDGNWSSTTTWKDGALPAITDDVQIDNNDDLTILSSNSYTIAELWMANGSSLTIEGNLTIDSLHVNNNAILNVSGTLTILGGISISQNAGLTINASGSLDVEGDLVADNGATLIVDGSVSIDGDVTFDNTGSIDVGDTGSIEILGDLDSGGATIDGSGPIDVSGTVDGDNSGDTQINGSLPIELVEFKAEYESSLVTVKWMTISEENNDFFTVERSVDGINFEILDFIDGAGNANNLLKYDYIDITPLSGIAYYRLKQTDFDGKFEYSDIVSVNNETITDYQINVYPNPIQTNSQFTIRVSGLFPEYLIGIELRNSIGNMINSYLEFSDGSGSVIVIVETQNILPGLYFINFITNDEIKTKKLIVK